MFGLQIIGIVFALLLLAVPIYLFWRICPQLLPTFAKTTVSLAVQMAFVAFYMFWLFRANSIVYDVLWLLAMTLLGGLLACQRTHLRRRTMLLPLVAGQFSTVVVVTFYLVLFVVRPDNVLSAQWIVPVTGLLLCAAQPVCAAALKEYYGALQRDNQLYHFLLGNGASHREAVMPFVRRAIVKAFTPMFANLSFIGVIVVPELTYGLLFGGVEPVKAVVLSAVILLSSITVSVVSILLTLYVADRGSFDAFGRFKHPWMKP